MREDRLKRIPAEVQCLGKDPFDSLLLAQEVARKMSRKHGQADKGVTAYHCGHCKKYHVGGNNPTFKKPRLR